MNKTFLSFLTAITLNLPIKAQPACSGVYLTASDFIVGKLYNVCASRSISKESYYDLLAKNHYFIIRPDYAWKRIDKKDIFAIKNCEGQIVRVWQGNNYYLLNPGEAIPIYKSVLNPVSKGNVVKIRYCFSYDSISEIQDLTIDNLKKAYPENYQFNEAIDANFKDDSDLYTYNKQSKSFELNRVYNTCK